MWRIGFQAALVCKFWSSQGTPTPALRTGVSTWFPWRWMMRSPSSAHAQAVRPGRAFAGTIVAAICEQVDCLPLAIELAAMQVRLLSLTELLERLSTRLALLGEEPGYSQRGSKRCAMPSPGRIPS